MTIEWSRQGSYSHLIPTETKIISFVSHIGGMDAFHKYTGWVIAMEGEEMLKQNKKTGKKLNAYKLYMKRRYIVSTLVQDVLRSLQNRF